MDSSGKIDIRDLHWMMDMLQSIDVGLVVLDRDYRIQIWNSFMANHSVVGTEKAIGQSLFELFPEVPQQWFKRKAEPVFELRSRTFTVWEQRPFLFRFKNYRPITGSAPFMYQNVSFIPLVSSNGQVDHVGLIVYDVTDQAVGKLALEVANEKLEHLSRTDRLTGLFNRGHWEETLLLEFKRARRTGQPFSLMMFDIDHFKKVNDTYGHPAGDEVIRRTAAALGDCIRETDVAGRYGGEEFAVLLVNTAAADAQVVAERIRTTVEAQTVSHDGRDIRYTVSLGIAEMTGDIQSHEQLIQQADEALYASKQGGRNRVSIYRG